MKRPPEPLFICLRRQSLTLYRQTVKITADYGDWLMVRSLSGHEGMVHRDELRQVKQ
jgi:hypothetical protein